MSFNCGCCFRHQEPGVKQIKVVTRTRKKTYFKEHNGRWVRVGFGTEIVKEETLCPECAEEHDEQSVQ